MKILITGGNGQLGSYLVRALFEEGHKIAVFDKESRLGDLRLNGMLTQKTIQFIKGDITVFSSVLDAVNRFRPEVIYHLASVLSLDAETAPPATANVNMNGTLYVLEAARLFGVRQVVYTSTLLTFDRGVEGRQITDTTLQRPASMYGISKLYSELLGCYYKEKYGIDFRAVRLATVIGPCAPMMHITVYNVWMIEKSFLGKPCEVFVSPEVRTPMIYYKDAVRGLLQLSKEPLEHIKTVCYNLSSYHLSAGELAAHVKTLLPHARITFSPIGEIVEKQQRRGKYIYDCSKAAEEWNWKPSYSVEDMILDFCMELEKSRLRK